MLVKEKTFLPKVKNDKVLYLQKQEMNILKIILNKQNKNLINL